MQCRIGRERHCSGRGLGLALIWVESRRWGKAGAETEGKIKTGAGAGELSPQASGCYYTSIMRNGEEGACLCTSAHLRLNMHNSHAKWARNSRDQHCCLIPCAGVVSARVNRLISQHRLLSTGHQGHLQV